MIIGGTNANNVTITGQIYAPNTDFTAHNNGELRGTGLFRTITADNTLSMYYDSSQRSVVAELGDNPLGVVMVQ